MHTFAWFSDAAVLGRQVQSAPGPIVAPIARVFGWIIDVLFNLVYAISPTNSLGFAIILLTIVAMTIMLPLGIKSQKSMMKMQQLNPEIEKIKAKYGNAKDKETQQKISQETQALWAKHKVNPLGGCLPMLIQMPMFFGLLFIMNNSFLYINRLNDAYHNLSVAIQNVPGIERTMNELTLQHLPPDWIENNQRVATMVHQGIPLDVAIEAVGGDVLNLADPAHMSQVLNVFPMESWDILFAEIARLPGNHLPTVQAAFDEQQRIVNFLGLPLLEPSGWFPPGIFIPILAVLTTLASSWLAQQVNKTKDEKMKTQQTVMLVVMPLFMGFITVNFAAGVGLYWVTMNLYRMVQQMVMNKQAGVPLRLPFSKEATD